MRIIAGSAGGMSLTLPKGHAIRPTPDRVKQAIFSSLGERIIEGRVLDLFAGTGALGLEAASRGAASVCLVDDSRHSIEAAAANAVRARLDDRVETIRGDVFDTVARLASRNERFGVILADPPYEKTSRSEESLARMLLNCPSLVSILATDGVLVMEHFKRDTLEETPHWQLHRELRHGDTIVSIFVARKNAFPGAAETERS